MIGEYHGHIWTTNAGKLLVWAQKGRAAVELRLDGQTLQLSRAEAKELADRLSEAVAHE